MPAVRGHLFGFFSCSFLSFAFAFAEAPINKLAPIVPESKTIDAVMSKLPGEIVQVHRDGEELVIKRGRCCTLAPTHYFTKTRSGWLLSSSTGGGEGIQFKLVDAVLVKDDFKIVYRAFVNKGTSPDLEFLLSRDASRVGLFRSKRDPSFDTTSTMWIDSKESSKLRVILRDDCPPDGEAC